MPRWSDREIEPAVADVLAAVAERHRLVTEHPVFGRLGSVDAVRTFMEHHVFAVWDFMSLLTQLRLHVGCAAPPWRPVGSATARRFVNELVLAEESDVHPHGGFVSHFELYLEAMAAVGADDAPVRGFLRSLRESADVAAALEAAHVPIAARRFVEATWGIVVAGSAPTCIGAFAFGRESLIPGMFACLRRLLVTAPEVALLCDYVDRHIELDGDAHTAFAFDLVVELCGEDPTLWHEARTAAISSIAARQRLWDGVLAAMGETGAADAPVARTT